MRLLYPPENSPHKLGVLMKKTDSVSTRVSDCKSIGYAFEGSNPSPTTTKDANAVGLVGKGPGPKPGPDSDGKQSCARIWQGRQVPIS